MSVSLPTSQTVHPLDDFIQRASRYKYINSEQLYTMLVNPWLNRPRWYYNNVYPAYPVVPPFAPIAPVAPIASVAPITPVYPATQPVPINQPVIQETVAYQDRQPSYNHTTVVVKPGSGHRKTVSFGGVGGGNYHGQGQYGKGGGSYGHGHGRGYRNSYSGNGNGRRVGK